MSPYPILGNKPIDQWKVVELKEELKKRKLPTKGLKDDLIKRLDRAIRVERENAEKEMQKASRNDYDAQGGPVTSNAVSISQSKKNMDKEIDNDKKMNNVETVEPLAPTVHVDVGTGADVVEKVENHVSTSTVEIAVNVVCEVPLSRHDQQNPEKQENGDSKVQLEGDDLKYPVEGDDVKPPQEDVILESASPNNQVSEVSLNLGIQVNSDSISSDSLSINEKNEFKDDIIADNAKLELDVSESEMVEPSSSDIVPVDGKSHPIDVEEPHENKVAVEDEEDNHIMKELENKNNDTVHLGYLEKLNLDQTSGEDTMEEDVPEKHVKSNHAGAEINDKNENNEVLVLEEESPILVGDVMKKDVEASQPITLVEKTELNDMSYPEKLNLEENSGEDTMEEDVPEKHVKMRQDGVEIHDRNEKSGSMENPVLVVGDGGKKDMEVNRLTTLAEKRKLNEQGGDGSSDPIKRQRKWKTETLKVSESQGSSISSLTAPKETLAAPTLKRSFSRSDSTTSDSAPKERVVPPSQKPPTNSLRIDQFLRPFTLKAVEELLGKTGTVKSFWMDHIKTHCFVSYSSVEEAEATRNAVYNLQWPPNGGRLLVADFVDPQEVKSRVEAPKPSAPTLTKAAPQLPPPRLQAAPPPSQQLPPPPPPAKAREGPVHLTPPPPVPEKVEPMILTLDVLFKKTKATPRIYYLPLSEDQVAAKLRGNSNSRGKPNKP